MAAMSATLLALHWVGGLVQSTLPTGATNLTLYHVNQANYTGITNMNTADAPGDAFFDMRTLLQYQQCHNKSAHIYPSECTNPEQFASNLIITKVVVAVSPTFSEYGECNVCINSTVPFTKPPVSCIDGEYACACSTNTGTKPCEPSIGEESIIPFFSKFARYMLPGSGPPAHWMQNLVLKLGGNWYSTVAAGECDNPASTSCEWKLVETVRKVNATCQANKVKSKIESLGSECFGGLPQPLEKYSDGYIACYYDTLLGEPAGYKYPYDSGGIPGKGVVKIWTDAFDQCPGI